MPLKPAVFLDWDGTIIDDVGYLDRVGDVAIYPWSSDALRLLKRGGFAIVVITNQSGVARGLYPESAVHDIHAHLTEALGRGGAVVDGWYHCPHHADAVDPAYRLDCDCRKPKPGMLTRAAAELGLDLARSVVVGDRWSDVAAARAVGAAGVLVRTGVGAREEEAPLDGLVADAIVPSLAEAASWILRGVPMSPRATSVAGDRDRLHAVIDRFARCRVAVIGDFVADEFVYGRVARISREAPVLILEYDKTDTVPGGAGNAANNVAALGARTRAVGLLGDDATGDRLRAALHAGVDARALARVRGRETPTKTRILAGGIHSAKQQIVRMDRGTHRRASADERRRFEQSALAATASIDAVLVSDYGGGLVTPRLVAAIKRSARTAKGDRPPILVDSRYDLGRYRGLTASTPNEAEAEALIGEPIGDDVRTLERAGRRLLDDTKMAAVLITRGSRGMALFEPDAPTRHIPIHGSDEIADVTGAGDTVIATMTLALAAGASPYEAAQLANVAGGIVVMKRGTATVSPEELRAALGGRR